MNEFKRNTTYSLSNEQAWESIRGIFKKEEDFNRMNFVMFSTSGVHGTYGTLEDAQRRIDGKPCAGCSAQSRCFTNECQEDRNMDITFIIMQPRLVRTLFGNLTVQTQEEVDFLKWCRENSWKAMLTIGIDPGTEGGA